MSANARNPRWAVGGGKAVSHWYRRTLPRLCRNALGVRQFLRKGRNGSELRIVDTYRHVPGREGTRERIQPQPGICCCVAYTRRMAEQSRIAGANVEVVGPGSDEDHVEVRDSDGNHCQVAIQDLDCGFIYYI
jgi:hypothetical protein